MKPGQRVIIVADTAFHGLEIGSTQVIEDIIHWKDGTKTATIKRYHVPLNNLKEADDKEWRK